MKDRLYAERVTTALHAFDQGIRRGRERLGGETVAAASEDSTVRMSMSSDFRLTDVVVKRGALAGHDPDSIADAVVTAYNRAVRLTITNNNDVLMRAVREERTGR